MAHVSAHEVEVVAGLLGGVVLGEVLPDEGAGLLEIDGPVLVVVFAGVEFVAGEGAEGTAHFGRLGQAVVSPDAAGGVGGHGFGAGVYFEAPVGWGHGGGGGLEAPAVEPVDEVYAAGLAAAVVFGFAEEDLQAVGFGQLPEFADHAVGGLGGATGLEPVVDGALDFFVEVFAVVQNFEVVAEQPFEEVGVGEHYFAVAVGVGDDVHPDHFAEGVEEVDDHGELVFDGAEVGEHPQHILAVKLGVDLPARHAVEAANYARLPDRQQVNAANMVGQSDGVVEHFPEITDGPHVDADGVGGLQPVAVGLVRYGRGVGGSGIETGAVGRFAEALVEQAAHVYGLHLQGALGGQADHPTGCTGGVFAQAIRGVWGPAFQVVFGEHSEGGKEGKE